MWLFHDFLTVAEIDSLGASFERGAEVAPIEVVVAQGAIAVGGFNGVQTGHATIAEADG